jgi:hypothetical protein
LHSGIRERELLKFQGREVYFEELNRLHSREERRRLDSLMNAGQLILAAENCRIVGEVLRSAVGIYSDKTTNESQNLAIGGSRTIASPLPGNR